jgi:hypothetical protein
MDALGPTFSLTGTEPFRPSDLVRDWSANEDDIGLVFRKPTKLLFRVACTALDDDAPIPQSALSSRVVRVCDGAPLPPMEELQDIIGGLSASGFRGGHTQRAPFGVYCS